MVQIIQNPNAELGRLLGKNLNTGLSALANQKLGQLQRQQTAQGLQALIAQQNKQISPQQAEAIAQLHPDLLKEYVKGAFNPKQALVNQQIGGKAPLTVAQQRHRDTIKNSYMVNKDLYDTTKEMLEGLRSGKVKFGAKNNLLAQYLPSQLPNKETGIFAKNAANVFTWTTEGQKGLQSKFRLQNTKAGKPGLDLLPEVNEHILEQINKRAEHNLKNFEKDYPGFNLDNEENYDYEARQPVYPAEAGEEGEWFDERPDAANLPDEAEFVENDGTRYMVKNGQWIAR